MRNARTTIRVMIMSISMCAIPAFGLIEFRDGGTHDITTIINDEVWVDYEAPGMETTVSVLDGGNTSYDLELQGYNDSHITVFGGEMLKLSAYDNSQISFSGGHIGGDLYAYDNSQISVSNGRIEGMSARDDAQIYMTGGSIKL